MKYKCESSAYRLYLKGYICYMSYWIKEPDRMTLSDSRHLAKVNAEMTLDSRVKMREQVSGTGSYNSRKLAKSFLGSRPLIFLWTSRQAEVLNVLW